MQLRTLGDEPVRHPPRMSHVGGNDTAALPDRERLTLARTPDEALPSDPDPDFDSMAAATFRWEPADDRWSWSDELYELLGYAEPARQRYPEPGYDLFLGHQHDGDRGRTAQALARVCKDGQPFVFEHRVVTVGNDTRTVIMSVRRLPDEPCIVVGILLDVSDSRRIYYAAEGDTIVGLQSQISQMTVQLETRELVSRATGVLVERHKITAQQAMELLRKSAQATARKLHDVASELLYTGVLPAAVRTGKARPGTASGL